VLSQYRGTSNDCLCPACCFIDISGVIHGPPLELHPSQLWAPMVIPRRLASCKATGTSRTTASCEFDLRDSKIAPSEQPDVENGRLHDARLLHRFEVFGNASLVTAPSTPVPPRMILTLCGGLLKSSGIKSVEDMQPETAIAINDSVARVTNAAMSGIHFAPFTRSSTEYPEQYAEMFCGKNTGIAGLALPATTIEK